MMKNEETKANCCTVCTCTVLKEDSNQDSSAGKYTKTQKGKNINEELKYFKQMRTSILQNGCPLSMMLHTTELPDSVNIKTGVNKTHVNVTLARPALINRLLHNLRGPPLSPKNKRRLFAIFYV